MRRIAHLSDLHFGTETPAVLEQLGRSVREFEPHLVVVTGDLTQRARSSQFRSARRWLDTLPSPQLIIPGNHDIAPLYKPLHRVLAPYARYQRYITRQLDGAFYDDELLVLALSSVQPFRWKEGTISRRQLDWIAEYAQRFPNQLRILAAHHPLVEAETERPTRRLRRHSALMSVLDSADIAVCMSGHLHTSFSGLAVTPLDEAGSVLAVHASTATSTRLRGHQNAYNQLTLDGTRLRVDAVAFGGERFERIASSAYERHAGVWQIRGVDIPD
ncbi:MAG TPA: metallophosphoesterase [Polyangiaceae bacterium]|nr:metallophosphoesterase [Polyangiaceae bacterium]